MSTAPPTAEYAPKKPRSAKTPLSDILAYSAGDGANSLIMNTFFGFAMLYYTKALGMSGTMAGLVMFLIMFWDAITDPLMGHITDNTRSRYGRRHPWILLGGFITVAAFCGVWAVPEWFMQSQTHLFVYMVAMNVILRTGSTIFAVPYIALGFEVCTDYNQRTTLQGVRGAVNMAVNLLGPAILVWMVFLRDVNGVKDSGISNPANYRLMGFTFAIIAMIFILFVVFATRKFATDSRTHHEISGIGPVEIILNLAYVILDAKTLLVFGFITLLFIGVVFVTSLQMFVYVDYMQFAAWEKSLVHGSTMVAAGLGAIFAGPLVRRLDKKQSIQLLLLIACAGNIILVLLFATGFVPKDLTIGFIPAATIIFLIFHDLYHVGSTASTTIANSMMADISEISKYHSGRLRDGSYSSMLSFVLKVAISVGILLCGLYLDYVGYEEGNVTPQVATYLMYGAFLGGTALTFLAILVISLYPVDRGYMEKVRGELARGRYVRFCAQCQYDLTGILSVTCPQCNYPIEEPPTAAIADSGA
jgi:GPH family glycoside/pentoside/hexuronide:cation symporter